MNTDGETEEQTMGTDDKLDGSPEYCAEWGKWTCRGFVLNGGICRTLSRGQNYRDGDQIWMLRVEDGSEVWGV